MLIDSGHLLMASAAGSRMHLLTLNGVLVWSVVLHAGLSALCLTPCHNALVCGFDDGAVHAWSLMDRHLLIEYVPCPAPVKRRLTAHTPHTVLGTKVSAQWCVCDAQVVCMAVAEVGLFVGTSRSDIFKYPAPPLDNVVCPGRSLLH